MIFIQFLISLAGATFLLLFAVRLVQTSIDRAFGSSFKRIVSGNQNPFKAAPIGLALALVLQSSTAVSLLVAEFTSTGVLGIGAAIAAVLGADLGSAIVVKILSFRLDWLTPALLAIGGFLFLKTSGKTSIQIGRMLMGLGFILLALQLLRQTMDPIRDSAFLPALSNYLSSDPISTFIVGVIFAFIMHSSVAVVLMCVTLVAIATIPFDVGVSLILGANLGSALIPIWLTRLRSVEVRRIPIANLLMRGSIAIIALFAIQYPNVYKMIEGDGTAVQLVLIHVGFNALLLIFVPFSNLIGQFMIWCMPDNASATKSTEDINIHSALDKNLIKDPEQAITCLRREVLRMGQLAEAAIRPIMSYYREGDLEQITLAKDRDLEINNALSSIRRFVIDVSEETLSKRQKRDMRRLIEYAINLETAGDVVAKRLLPLAATKAKQNIMFSEEGRLEIVRLHEGVMENIGIALNVIINEDVESARRLLEEKADIATRERTSRKKHLKRLQLGTERSLESSDLHLETLRALKEFNSQICSIAYAILHREGLLLNSRLVEIADS